MPVLLKALQSRDRALVAVIREAWITGVLTPGCEQTGANDEAPRLSHLMLGIGLRDAYLDSSAQEPVDLQLVKPCFSTPVDCL